MTSTMDHAYGDIPGPLAAKGGKYLTFELDGGTYGLEINNVKEIIGMVPVTRVPRVPDYIRGVINLRGRIVPTVELRTKFGLATQEDTRRTCIIVVEVPQHGTEVRLGLVVDAVSEVVDIPASCIEPPPAVHDTGAGRFLEGVGVLHDELKMLLDTSAILMSRDFAAIEQLTHEATQTNV